MDDLISNPYKTFEQAVEDFLKNIHPNLSDVELKLMIQKYCGVGLQLNSLYRLEVFRALAEAGISVTVYGNGWDQTDLFGHPHFDCHPPVTFAQGIALMEDSKIVLNQLSWFKDGCCERVFNAMLQGSVCLTDDSIYLREQFTDGEDIVFYSLSALEKLPDIVGGLLQDTARMQHIADSGYYQAVAHHTWAHRAAELAKLL